MTRAAKERPLLMAGEMVRATLREVDPKTQTRRIATVRSVDNIHAWNLTGFDVATATATFGDGFIHIVEVPCPYGRPGDRLWVRETFARNVPGCEEQGGVSYRADHNDPRGDGPAHPMRWTPSIHMTRALSRIDLQIAAVRVERLHDITEQDAQAEGVAPLPCHHADCDTGHHRTAFAELWDEINGDKVPWASNPWVWVVSFRRVRP